MGKCHLSKIFKPHQEGETKSKFKDVLRLLSLNVIPLFVAILASIVVATNIQAKVRNDSLESDSSIFISLISPKQYQNTEIVKNVPQENHKVRQDCLATSDLQAQESLPDDSTPSNGSLSKTTAPVSDNPKTSDIIEYEVKGGETISTIAAKFGISSNTILWENNLFVDSTIKPGEILHIPPVTGVSHKVKNGETLDGIASTYKADIEEIMQRNKLVNASDIEIDQTLIIPEGKKAEPIRPKPKTVYLASGSSRSYTPSSSSSSRYYAQSKGGHKFPYGYCTYYVSTKRSIPWGGNARSWLHNARAAGYQIGTAPSPGAIVVTRESWWGHVGYVEKVEGNTITISEMNYRGGWGRVTRRTIPASDGVVRGYIY